MEKEGKKKTQGPELKNEDLPFFLGFWRNPSFRSREEWRERPETLRKW